jgi:hypothetical protein
MRWGAGSGPYKSWAYCDRIVLLSLTLGRGWQAHRLFIGKEEGVSNARYQACIGSLMALAASPGEGLTQERALFFLGEGHRFDCLQWHLKRPTSPSLLPARVNKVHAPRHFQRSLKVTH